MKVYLLLQIKNNFYLQNFSFFKNVFLFIICFIVIPVEGKLNVLTSSTNLKSLTKYIAGDRIQLESILKGQQDPHFLSPKPSYMLKARTADLLIFIGMDLEIGWLPSIIEGARNPRIQKGKIGYLDTSQFIQALSIPEGKIDRFFGDIHPYGNPHFLLDPVRAVQVSKGITQRLSRVDPENGDYYVKNYKLFEKNIKNKIKIWKKRIKDSTVQKIVSYHSSFEYFLDKFQINLTGLIEEKPGIPPSAKHILKLIKKMKESQTSCILMSSFYSNKRVNKIKQSVPTHIEVVAIEVGAFQKVTDYFLVIEGIVQAIENCGTFAKEQKKRN